MSLRIKGWAKFQHFKDRTPPWIKLYRDILDDPDWHELDGDAAKTLTMLWLIASEDETHQGLLPCTRKLAFRLRITESQLNQRLTKLSHWVERGDIGVISERYRDDAPETERETERETETETDIDGNFSAELQCVADASPAPVIALKPAAEARGTRLPSDWTLPDDWAAWARQARPDLEIQIAAESFRDFWCAKPGAGGRKTDWLATWRNWVRNQKAPYKPLKTAQAAFSGAL